MSRMKWNKAQELSSIRVKKISRDFGSLRSRELLRDRHVMRPRDSRGILETSRDSREILKTQGRSQLLWAQEKKKDGRAPFPQLSQYAVLKKVHKRSPMKG